MTDEHGMLRNGSSIDSVGIVRHESNAVPAPATNSINNSANDTNNNNSNNHDNARNNGNGNGRDQETHPRSPVDTTNGNSTDAIVSDNCNKQPNNTTNNYTNNGSPASNPFSDRLQFFKDGKFILELARSKDNERGWISVPRKTYWPPSALSQNNVNNHKNESSTSLSFSDDNSSIQSSPWQPERSWKQPTPRKNISKELNLCYHRPVPIVLSPKSKCVSKRLRRQPHSKKHQPVEYAKRSESEGDRKFESKPECKDSDVKKESNGQMDSGDTVDGSTNIKDEPMSNSDDEKMDCKTTETESNGKSNDAKDETDAGSRKMDEQVTRSTFTCFKKRLLRKAKLGAVIEKLITRASEQPTNVSAQSGPGFHFNSSSRANDLLYSHQHVSPRKRILREFEKVSLEDRQPATMKRSRSKNNATTNYSTVVAHQTVSE